MQDQQTDHSQTSEVPETVTSFLAFMNQNGKCVSREWMYGQFKKRNLPRLKIGRKILVMRGKVLARMEELGGQ